jgi:hypothetical protein
MEPGCSAYLIDRRYLNRAQKKKKKIKGQKENLLVDSNHL